MSSRRKVGTYSQDVLPKTFSVQIATQEVQTPVQTECGAMDKSSASCSLSSVPGRAQLLTSELHDLTALLLSAESRTSTNSCISEMVPASAGNGGAASSSPV